MPVECVFSDISFDVSFYDYSNNYIKENSFGPFIDIDSVMDYVRNVCDNDRNVCGFVIKGSGSVKHVFKKDKPKRVSIMTVPAVGLKSVFNCEIDSEKLHTVGEVYVISYEVGGVSHLTLKYEYGEAMKLFHDLSR